MATASWIICLFFCQIHLRESETRADVALEGWVDIRIMAPSSDAEVNIVIVKKILIELDRETKILIVALFFDICIV